MKIEAVLDRSAWKKCEFFNGERTIKSQGTAHSDGPLMTENPTYKLFCIRVLSTSAQLNEADYHNSASCVQ